MAMSGKLKLGLIAFVVVDLLLVVTFVALYLVNSDRAAATDLLDMGLSIYPKASDLKPFTLSDEHGNPFSADDLTGYWNFFFFGFTACPDICPITMAELDQFYTGLDAAARERARVIMVSVDPARDDVATLAGYVDSYNEDFVGLTGNIGVIAELAAQFFVVHSKPGLVAHNDHSVGAKPLDYMIEHSGHLAIVNPEGKFAAVMRSPVRDQDLTTAYRHLLADY
ncbi:MAG: SCO family protein [Gammaproteobacteria bacterium]|nr:SCO family protein [Gammaproteobacteria bacterium]